MIKKIIFLVALLSASSVVLMAQVSYDVTVVEDKRIVSGSDSFQKSDDEIFANAFLWAVNEGPGRKDEIVDYDFVKRQFTMAYNLKKDDAPAYNCRMTVKVSQGQLMFLVSEIKIQGGLLNAFLSFDKLKPEKKTKHQDIINEFQSLNNRKLQDLFSFVLNNSPKITNWKSVCLGKIERGMSSDEVKLIYGKPVNIQESGADTQYLFSTFVYVFLENGFVKSFVN